MSDKRREVTEFYFATDSEGNRRLIVACTTYNGPPEDGESEKLGITYKFSTGEELNRKSDDLFETILPPIISARRL